MPEAVPVQTGSDVLQYTGNAALAAGANPGAILPQQGDPFGGIAATEDQILQHDFKTIDAIHEHQAQMNVLKYKQKIKDQDDLANMLSETNNSLFNMKGGSGKNMSYAPLPEDQKILLEKGDAIRKAALSNPSGYALDPEFNRQMAEYKALVNHAGVRSAAFTQYNLDAANTNDPEERKSILSQRDSEIKSHGLNDAHMPEPHLPKLASDPNDLIPVKDANDPKNRSNYQVKGGLDADDNLVYTTKDGLNESMLDFRPTLTPASKSWASAANMANDYLKTIANNPTLVAQQNKNIDAINQERGYVDENGNPTNRHFIPHVAEVVQGQNGQPQVKLNVDPNNPNSVRDISYALMAEKYGALNESKEIKKSAIELQKAKKDVQPTTEELKEEQNKQAVVSMRKDVQDVFKTPVKQSVLNRLKNTVLPGRLGIDQSEYNIYPPLSKGKADRFIGIPQEETSTKQAAVKDKKGNVISPEVTTKVKGGSLKPDAVYPIENKASGERELVYVKDGAVVARVNEKQAVINGLKHETNYQPALYSNKLGWVDKVLGGDNEGTKSSNSTASVPLVRKTIGGVTYEKGSDNKWYKIE